MAADRVPEPPWRPTEEDAARRTPLSREAIVNAAFGVLDREGLDRLSMRRVARELGTGAATLYWHVRNKDQLIDLMLERAMAEAAPPGPPDAERWQEQLKDMARAERALFARHRDLARASLGRVPFGPSLAELAEGMLGILKAGGVPDRIAGYAGDLLSLYVAASSYEESLGLKAPDGREATPAELKQMLEEYLASLPADRFPYIHALRHDLVAGDQDERFELGLEVIVAGLSSFAGRA
jgi:TetR/AcrR family transcriptional regulator, tetracycline repressor protein